MYRILLLVIFICCFIFGASAQIIPNGSFEDWETDSLGIPRPVGWEVSNFLDTNGVLQQSIWQDTTAANGDFSARIRIQADSICNVIEGNCPGVLVYETSINPNLYLDSLSYFYKNIVDSNVIGGGGTITLSVLFGDSNSVEAYFDQISGDQIEWRRRVVRIDTSGIIYLRLIIIGGSNNTTFGFSGSSTFWIDNLQLRVDSTNATSTKEVENTTIKVYPTLLKSGGVLFIENESILPIGDQYRIVNVLGEVLQEGHFSQGNHNLSIELPGLSNGVYFLQVKQSGANYASFKFLIVD